MALLPPANLLPELPLGEPSGNPEGTGNPVDGFYAGESPEMRAGWRVDVIQHRFIFIKAKEGDQKG